MRQPNSRHRRRNANGNANEPIHADQEHTTTQPVVSQWISKGGSSAVPIHMDGAAGTTVWSASDAEGSAAAAAGVGPGSGPSSSVGMDPGIGSNQHGGVARWVETAGGQPYAQGGPWESQPSPSTRMQSPPPAWVSDGGSGRPIQPSWGSSTGAPYGGVQYGEVQYGHAIGGGAGAGDGEGPYGEVPHGGAQHGEGPYGHPAGAGAAPAPAAGVGVPVENRHQPG